MWHERRWHSRLRLVGTSCLHVKSIAVKKHGDVECVCYSTINPLDTNISIYFLHTVLYTFPIALTKRICLTIKSVFSW